jgi:hypothetical protein
VAGNVLSLLPGFRPPRADDQGDAAPLPGPSTLFSVFRRGAVRRFYGERSCDLKKQERRIPGVATVRGILAGTIAAELARRPKVDLRQPRDESCHVGNQSTHISLIHRRIPPRSEFPYYFQ